MAEELHVGNDNHEQQEGSGAVHAGAADRDVGMGCLVKWRGKVIRPKGSEVRDVEVGTTDASRREEGWACHQQ